MVVEYKKLSTRDGSVAVRVELVDSLTSFYRKHHSQDKHSFKDVYWMFLCQWYNCQSVVKRRSLLNQTTAGREVTYRGKILHEASDNDIMWHLAEEVAIAYLGKTKELDREVQLRSEIFRWVLLAIRASSEKNEELVMKLGSGIVCHLESLGANKFNKPYGCSNLTILDTYLKHLMKTPSDININFITKLINNGARSSTDCTQYLQQLANIIAKDRKYRPLVEVLRETNLVIAIDIDGIVVAKAIPWVEYQRQQRLLHAERAHEEVLLVVQASRNLDKIINKFQSIKRPSKRLQLEYDNELAAINKLINQLQNMITEHIHFLGVKEFNSSYDNSGCTVLDVYLKELAEIPGAIQHRFVSGLITEGARLNFQGNVLPEYCTRLANSLHDNAVLCHPLIMALKTASIIIVVSKNRTEAISSQDYQRRQKRLLDVREAAVKDRGSMLDIADVLNRYNGKRTLSKVSHRAIPNDSVLVPVQHPGILKGLFSRKKII
jgi:hypothetical protein